MIIRTRDDATVLDARLQDIILSRLWNQCPQVVLHVISIISQATASNLGLTAT